MMPLPTEIIQGLNDVCYRDKDITDKEKVHISRLTEIALNSFYEENKVPGETYVAFLSELRSLCSAIDDEREKIREEWRLRFQAAAEAQDEGVDEVLETIKSIAGSKPEVIRMILTAIVNCERSSVPEEFRGEFSRLQKVFGLDKFLDN